MGKLAFIGNPRVAVPYFLAAAMFAAVIGVAAATVSTVGVASAGDARHVAPAPTGVGAESASVPEKPRKLTAERLDDGSVKLTWRKPRGGADITGYKITFSTPDLAEPVTVTYDSGFTETPIINDKGRVTGVLVTLVKHVGGDFKVKYRVRAYNEQFDGAESKQVRVPRIAAPDELMRLNSDEDPHITVCWPFVSGEPTHYEVMRRLGSEKASSMRVIATVAEIDRENGDLTGQCYADNWTDADTEYVYKVRGVQGSWKGKPSPSLRAMRAAGNGVDE